MSRRPKRVPPVQKCHIRLNLHTSPLLPAQRGPPSEASKLAKTAAGPALIDGVIYLDTMLQKTNILGPGFCVIATDSTSFRWISSRNSGTAVCPALSQPVPGPETSVSRAKKCPRKSISPANLCNKTAWPRGAVHPRRETRQLRAAACSTRL